MSSRQETRWRKLNRQMFDESVPVFSPRETHYQSPPTAQKPAMPTKPQTRRFCQNWWREALPDDTATACVEAFAAEYPQAAHWLDDPDHWIWLVAVDALMAS